VRFAISDEAIYIKTVKGNIVKVEDVSEILQLSVPEKILFVEELWDSISSAESEIPIPDSHKEELDRRLKRHLKAPGELLSLDELQMRIEKRK